ncbi:hypothetical protein GNF78_16785, partial [Clostridium perfringens]
MYLVVGSPNCRGADTLHIVEEALAGGVTLVQFREKGPGAFILLPDVHPVGSDPQSQVHIVIDDERHAFPAAGVLQPEGQGEPGLAGERAGALFPKLYKRDPSGQRFLPDVLGIRPAAVRTADDQVHTQQFAHALRLYPLSGRRA